MAWMLILTALSAFVEIFYSPHVTVITILQNTIAVGVALAVTFYLGDFLMTIWLPRLNDGVSDERLSRLFSSYVVCLLSLQYMLGNILPLSFAILELWPLYVVVIMWRSMRMFDLREGVTGKFILAVIVAFVVPLQVLYRLFNSIIAN